MDAAIAGKIAQLLNKRNELTRKYNAAMILEHVESYLYLEQDTEIVACIRLSRVQWYQVEIHHLTVAETHEGRGYGRKLVRSVLTQAMEKGARLAQCTIREGNVRSEGLFVSEGFVRTCAFFNQMSGNTVFVLQKALTLPPT